MSLNHGPKLNTESAPAHLDSVTQCRPITTTRDYTAEPADRYGPIQPAKLDGRSETRAKVTTDAGAHQRLRGPPGSRTLRSRQPESSSA